MTAPANYGTAGRLIRFAMKDAGWLQEGDDPNSEQLAENLQRLNDMINMWQTQGLKLFLLKDQSITLVAGQATYTLGTGGDVSMNKPLRVLQAYWLSSANIRTPLNPLSWEEYLRLSQTTSTGAINSYFVNKQTTLLNVSFWNTPDAVAATGTCHLLITQQASNMISLDESVAFPPEWFMALRWGLADEISSGQPESVQQRCQMRAAAFREALEGWDVEDASTRFEPNAQLTPSSSFS